MRRLDNPSSSAFSLLEVIIVVAIIAVLAAIAIPRLCRGSQGAADSALADDLALLRGAIDHYAAEHGGTFPHWNAFSDQLTQYTDDEGNAQTVQDTTHIYGPYLRTVPPLPVGANQGKTGVKHKDGDEIGWIYDMEAGTIQANCADDELDQTSKPYNKY